MLYAVYYYFFFFYRCILTVVNCFRVTSTGFSDPYCMLGIQPGTVSPQPGSGLPPSPANSPSPYQPPLSPRPAHATARTLSEGGIELPDGRHDHHDKLRKHHRYVFCPYNAGGDLLSGHVPEFIISRYLKKNHMPIIL